MKPQARPDPVNPLPFTKAALRKIQKRIDEKWTIERMAEIAHVRVRALHRHIQDAAGLAPSEWLTQQPIACARDLLEETNFSIDEITPSYGFGATTNFRQYCRTTIYHRTSASQQPLSFPHHDPTAEGLLSKEPDTHFELTSKT